MHRRATAQQASGCMQWNGGADQQPAGFGSTCFSDAQSFGHSGFDGTVDRANIGRIGSAESGGLGRGPIGSLFQDLKPLLTSSRTGPSGHHVDFGFVQPLEIEETGNQNPYYFGATVSAKTKLRSDGTCKKHWSIQELFDHVRSDAKVQETSNAIMCAIEKARGRALECGTSEPPGLEELDEDLALTTIPAARSFSGSTGRAKIWDTGASKGMSKVAGATGEEVPGPSSRVATGAGIVVTKKWFREQVPFGPTRHVGLENTEDTISAGQVNSERGVETSWLAPEEIPSNKTWASRSAFATC